MKRNMGVADKSIRIILAVIITGLYLSGKVTGLLGVVLLVLAAIFVLTSFIGFCPAYAVFGISTKKKDTKL